MLLLRRTAKQNYRAWPSVLLLLILLPTSILAENDCQPWQPSYKTLPDLVIGEIQITTNDVFDPTLDGEQAWYHRLTNKLHVKTFPSVIRYQLLFQSGDQFDETVLDESARLLRRNRYLRAAAITPVALCGNAVNIDVLTEDHWTLTPSLNYKQAGGARSWSMEIQELNVLGIGKEIKFALEVSEDETETLFQYRDKNLLGTRNVLSLEQQTLNGDDAWQIAFGLPFFGLNEKSAWGFIAEDARRKSSYVRVADRLAHSRTSRVETFAQRKLDRPDAIYRVGGGIRYERELYTVDGVESPELEPFEFDYVYPYLSFQYLKPDYVSRENLYSIGRVEDITIGFRLSMETGLITRALGNNDDLLRFAFSAKNGWAFENDNIASVELTHIDYLGTGRYSSGIRAAAIHVLDEDNLLQFNFNAQRRSGYSADHYSSVGGEVGLKGFPNRYQRGDRRVLGAAEYRHIFDWYPFRLFRLGLSNFYEVGAAWTSDTERDWLHNIGFGLVISPTRTSTHNLMRFDIVVPTSDRDDIKPYQVYIGTQISY